MRRVLLFLVLSAAVNTLMAQYVYTINADSVKITNHCDTAELIIENHTQNISGFLFNKGRGRTEFRKAFITINDSTYLLGTDTLHTGRPSFWKQNDVYPYNIYNTNTGYVGIGTSNPERTLDINGNLRATGGVFNLSPGGRTGIRQTCLSTHIFNACGSVGYISLGFDTLTGVGTPQPDPLTVRQKNLSVGIGNNNPEARLHIRSIGVTDTISTLQADNAAGTSLLRLLDNGNLGLHRLQPAVLLDLPGPVSIDDTSAYRINYRPVVKLTGLSDSGYNNLFLGDSAGAYNTGIHSVLVGNAAGIHNSGANNTFLGFGTGRYSSGYDNTFSGYLSGRNSINMQNAFYGSLSGQNNTGAGNCFLGYAAGINNTGSTSVSIGYQAGTNNTGSGNLMMGTFAGGNNTGSFNCLVGSSSGYRNTGADNVMVGSSAGLNNTSDNSVFVGGESGQDARGFGHTFVGSLTTGMLSANSHGITLIGRTAQVSTSASPDISDATAIGYNAKVNSAYTMVFGDEDVKSWLFNSSAAAGTGKALVVGFDSTNGNGAYLSAGGSWTNASDRDKKENIDDINTGEMLDKIAELPVTRWNYKGLPEQHIGPMAQDFYRLFRLGTDDKTISTIDPAGIALACIQGLYRNWQETKKTAEDQQSTIKNLQDQLAAQQQQIKQLTETVNRVLAQQASLK